MRTCLSTETAGQKAMIAGEALPLYEKEAKKRMSQGGKGVEKIPPPEKSKARDDAAKAFVVNPSSIW